MTRTSFVLALAGSPSSGKTTVAHSLASDTGAAHISFGGLIRTEAASLHLHPDRSTLQNLGTHLLDELGPTGLCQRALSKAGITAKALPIIWDGVRHTTVLDGLRQIYAPTSVTLVVLAPPEIARRERFAAQASSIDQLLEWEVHESESRLAQLIAQADLVCEAPSPQAAMLEIISLLRSRQ